MKLYQDVYKIFSRRSYFRVFAERNWQNETTDLYAPCQLAAEKIASEIIKSINRNQTGISNRFINNRLIKSNVKTSDLFVLNRYLLFFSRTIFSIVKFSSFA